MNENLRHTVFRFSYLSRLSFQATRRVQGEHRTITTSDPFTDFWRSVSDLVLCTGICFMPSIGVVNVLVCE
jgi:hypothetical protein